MALGGTALNAVRIGVGTQTPTSVIHVLGQSSANFDTKSPLLRLESFNGFDMYYRYDGGLIINGGVGGNYEIEVIGDIAYTGGIFDISDIRKKQDIREIPDALGKIKEIRGVTYKMIDHPESGREYGVIAQEIEKIFPELVKEGNDGYKRVEYLGLIAPMIEAIKQLDEENKKLLSKYNSLVTRNNATNQKLEELEDDVAAIKESLNLRTSQK